MKLSQLSSRIDPVIFKRGEDYRDEGYVLSLEEIEPLQYVAEVEGSELYNVVIHLNSKDDVVYIDCDCPYDFGPVCKHAVAVLLEIKEISTSRESIAIGIEDQTISASKSKSDKKQTLAQQLTALDKDELVALLVQFSKDIKEVKQALILRFTDADSKGSLQQYTKIIRTSIKQSSDRSGFVSYRDVYKAVDGAEKVMVKANETLIKNRYLHAFEIYFCIIHEMSALLQYCDDSDGVVGGLIQNALDIMYDAVDELEHIPDQDRLLMFRLLLSEAADPSLHGWSEWQLSLYASASCLITTDAERELWNKQLDHMENYIKQHSSYSSFFSEQAAILRYNVIQTLEGSDQAGNFVEEHLNVTEFRKLAIEDAIKRLDYDKALQLAEEGEQKDAERGYPGLVMKWKKCRYQVYEYTHQVKLQKQLAEEFLLDGEYEYYAYLKELNSKEEWEDVYEDLLNRIESRAEQRWGVEFLYKQILIEENEMSRLLKYIRNHTHLVVDYYTYLVKDYAEETFQLFKDLIMRDAAHAAKRNQYKKVCGIIRHLIKAGGRVEAEGLVMKLKMTYSSRPAFIDELEQLKLH